MHLPNKSDAVKPGDAVILGYHDRWEFWNSSMDIYVGMIAKIVRYYDCDAYGCHRFIVDIDGGNFKWRVENMTLDTLFHNVGHPTCIECGLTNTYVNYRPNYVCGVCSGWRKAIVGDIVDDVIISDDVKIIDYEPITLRGYEYDNI